MAGIYHYCSSCKRIENNMTIFRCPDCDKPYEIVRDNTEEKNSNEKWYIKCGSCREWVSFADKDNIPKACPFCYDTDIKNIGEDSILSEEEYLLEIGELKNEVAEKDRVLENKRKKTCSEEADNTESDRNNQLDASESESIPQNDETENVNKPETVDDLENNRMADDFAEKSKRHEMKLEGQKSDIEEISYIEFVNNHDGKVIKIGRGKHILGKLGDVERDYFNEKRYIGRQHAMVVVDETEVYIEDWNSTNGTRINGEVIYKRQGKMRIVNEDIITMADQNFEVRICR